MIACHNVARDRMLELIGKYGRDAVDQAARALIEQSDRLLGERLAELPDGRWEARQRMEVKGEIYRVNLSLTKREGILTFDFDGSSPQSRYPINASYWTSWGALFSPIYAVLCPDITWNEGIAHHVRMTAPEGSVVNCKRPAPLSVATVAAANLVSMAALNCISKMLLASERHEKLATGGWNGGAISVFLYGKNQHGLMAISFLTDIFAGAGGARSWGDGMDVCGDIPNPIARFANIETIEARLPVRYIFRRRVCDSGGAGQYRGGAGIECGITPHDMSGSGLNFSICGKGTHYPATEGIVGGYVGSTCHYALLHHSDEPRGSSPVVWFDPGAHEFERQTTRVNWGIYPLRDNDVLYVRCSGGGGYGDPLKRDVAAVHRDYSLGLVSLRDAREIYGVVINEKSGEVDAIATPRRRRALVAQRLKEHGRQYAHVAEPDY
jgi:N-methylhydantoinase B